MKIPSHLRLPRPMALVTAVVGLSIMASVACQPLAAPTANPTPGPQPPSQPATSGASAADARLVIANQVPVPSASLAAGIAVSGEGTVNVQPDVASISVGVQTQAQTAKDAQAQNNQLMGAVLSQLKGMGIADKDIRTSGVGLFPENAREGTQITGYRAINTVTITVQDVTRAGEILDAAVTAGANTAGTVQFGLKDDSQLQRQALQAAVQSARTKADALAQPLGLKVTSVQSIEEQSASVSPRSVENFRDVAMAQASSVPIQSGEIVVRAQVRVVFGFGS